MTFILIATILYCSVSVYADQIPSPRNMRIHSYNMGLVLAWDPPQKSIGMHFKYTAEYKGWNAFEAVCMNVSSLSCDFTSSVSSFGTFQLRVRTELNGKNSDWVETDNIILEEITVIGAPDVRLQTKIGGIEVDITDPVLRKSTLKELFTSVEYRISYGIKGDVKKEMPVAQNRVMLMNLIPEEQYCVEVQILLNKRVSLRSNTTCEFSGASDEMMPWLIAVVLVVSCLATFIAVLLISVLVWSGYKGVRFIHPQAKLPEHFKQYLLEHPKPSVLLVMQNSMQPKELYHEICIISAQDVPAAAALMKGQELKDSV